MSRLFVTAILLTIYFTTCEGRTNISVLYDDMDTDGNGFVTYIDITGYFRAYTDFLLVPNLTFAEFDLIWGLVYNDSRPVISYIFNEWDKNITDGRLTDGDAQYLYNQIDDPSTTTPGFLHFDWEFYPYFTKLYDDAESQTATVG